MDVTVPSAANDSQDQQNIVTGSNGMVANVGQNLTQNRQYTAMGQGGCQLILFFTNRKARPP
jgi:hypothetical protein